MATPVDFNCLLRDAFIAYDFTNMKHSLSRGASPNLKLHGKLSLLHCSYNAKTIRLLLRYGADISVRDKRGRTPLLSALENRRHSDSIRELLQNGADINVRDKKGSSVLHYALTFDCDSDVFTELLRRGAKVNVKDMDGNTPLHLASRFKTSPEVVRKLLIYGADVSALDQEDNSPLHIAVKYVSSINCENWETIDQLIEFGASVTTKSKHESPLEMGIRMNKEYGNMLIKLSVFNCFNSDYKIKELFRHVNKLNNVDLMSYLNCCVREIDLAKMLKINSRFLIDFIRNRNGKVKPLYLPSFRKKALIQEISLNYGIYKVHILLIIKTCLIRASLLINLRKMMLRNRAGVKNGIFLNYDCMCKVATYLSNEELFNLLCAFEEQDKCLLLEPMISDSF